jgi:hypothetical protein
MPTKIPTAHLDKDHYLNPHNAEQDYIHCVYQQRTDGNYDFVAAFNGEVMGNEEAMDAANKFAGELQRQGEVTRIVPAASTDDIISMLEYA